MENSSNATTEKMVHRYGYWFSASYLKQLVNYVKGAIETLRKEKYYGTFELKDLYGPEEWGAVPDGEKRRMGQLVAAMSRARNLTIVIVETEHEYPVIYRLVY